MNNLSTYNILIILKQRCADPGIFEFASVSGF